MRKWGLTLLFIGTVSFVLPLIGLQLRIMNIFGGRKEVSLLLIGAGAILFLASLAKSRRTPPGESSPMPRMERPETQESSCPACGAKIAPDDRFCGVCGVTLSSMTPLGAATCGNCGKLISPEDRFCGECGAPRGAGEARHQITPASSVPHTPQQMRAGVARIFFFGLLTVSGILAICGILISAPEVSGGLDPEMKTVWVWASAAILLSTSLSVLFPGTRFRRCILAISLAWSVAGAFLIWITEYMVKTAHGAPYWAILAVFTGPSAIVGVVISSIFFKKLSMPDPTNERKD
jgi:RNA polymerase subunit RPABC4/transcription elongation factor Spt4